MPESQKFNPALRQDGVKRVTCPWCHRQDIRLRENGVMRLHFLSRDGVYRAGETATCDGSGRLPQDRMED